MNRNTSTTGPAARTVHVNGVTLCVFEWPGEGRPLVLAHATGFHARCWDAVLRRLPGRPAFAIDLCGHGRSDKPMPPYNWNTHAEDVAAIVDRFDLEDAIGVGHSMGGHSIALAAEMRPQRFAGLVLCDPTIMSPERYDQHRTQWQGEHFSARRRNEWDSPVEMYQRFKDRYPFNRWLPEALWDYCLQGLLPSRDGRGYVLACPPAVEAAMYGTGGGNGQVLEMLGRLTMPVHVLRARERTPDDPPDSFGPSVTWPGLAAALPQGADVLRTDLSHFIPQEAPDLVAEHILKVGNEAHRARRPRMLPRAAD